MPRLALLFLLNLAVLAGPANAADTSPLEGTWHFDPARSTELSPWKDCVLTIRVLAGHILIDRTLSWSRRAYSDHLAIVSGQTVTVSVEMWPDNRHLGASIGDDHTERIHAIWLDNGRILRTSTDLVLATQQGSRAVNILTDYKLSSGGDQLTVIERRSTRNRPVVYTFRRTGVARP